MLIDVGLCERKDLNNMPRKPSGFLTMPKDQHIAISPLGGKPSNEEINGLVVILREIVRPFNYGYSLNRFEYVAAPDVFEEILRSFKIPGVPKAAPVKEQVG